MIDEAAPARYMSVGPPWPTSRSSDAHPAGKDFRRQPTDARWAPMEYYAHGAQGVRNGSAIDAAAAHVDRRDDDPHGRSR